MILCPTCPLKTGGSTTLQQRYVQQHLFLRPCLISFARSQIWDLSNTTDGSQRYVVCDGSGEDPECSDSVPALRWSAADHDVYMGTKVCLWRRMADMVGDIVADGYR